MENVTHAILRQIKQENNINSFSSLVYEVYTKIYMLKFYPTDER